MATEDVDLLAGCLGSLVEIPAELIGEVIVVGRRLSVTPQVLEVVASHPDLSLRLVDVESDVGSDVESDVESTGVAEAFDLAAACARMDEVLLLHSSERLTMQSADASADVRQAMHGWSGLAVPTAVWAQAAEAVASSPTPEVFWCRLLSVGGEDQVHAPVALCKDPDRVGAGDLDSLSEVLQRLKVLQSAATLGSAKELRHALRASLAGRVNDHLRSHPEDHARVVSEAESLGLNDMPWSVVNAGLARDLAITYCFPPALDTSGMVAAKRLHRRGLLTDVISQDLSQIRTIDPDASRLAGPVLARTRVLPGRPSFIGWHSIRRFAAGCWETVEEWEAHQGPYRSLYSRAMAVSSHYASALVKGRRPGIHWVAEHSDPLAVDELGEFRPWPVLDDWLSQELTHLVTQAGFRVLPDRRLFEWAEHLTYALADEIVFTNENQRALMLDRCSDRSLAERAHSISRVEHHPVPPLALYEQASTDLTLPADVLHVAYFGVFYGTRDLGDVVTALQELSQAERDRIHLHVFTSGPDELSIAMARAGLAGTVTAYPYRPVLEFLNLTRRFDVLLVNDARTAAHHDLNPYLPSKFADYRGSGTPIWAMVEPDSMLSRQEVAYKTVLGDHQGALATLRLMIASFTGESAGRVSHA